MHFSLGLINFNTCTHLCNHYHSQDSFTISQTLLCCLYSRIFQPWHYWHIRIENSVLGEAVLCIVGCLEASLASVQEGPAAAPSNCDNQNCLKSLASGPLVGDKISPRCEPLFYSHTLFQPLP